MTLRLLEDGHRQRHGDHGSSLGQNGWHVSLWRTPVNVLFVHFGDDLIAGSEVALLELLRHFPRQDVTPFLWCNGRAMQKAAEAIGIPVFRDDFTYYFDYASPPFSPRDYLRLVRRGRQLISHCDADLVHCNSAAPAQWMLPACRWQRRPMLVNMHAPYLRRSRYVLGLHLADRIVAVASAISEPLTADGMARDRIGVVYNGFDREALLRGDAAGLRDALGIPPEAVVGAIAGSLILRKAHDVLFEAMRAMAPPSRPFYVLVIGEGPERSSFEKAAAGLPVHFLGYRADLGAILRDSADFLVAPSRQEAFGRVIIEAAFAGIPAIGSNVDGIPEAIQDNVTGLLVPPETPAVLARAISRLVEDDSLRHGLGLAAQRRAMERFAIETSVAGMLAEYRATLDRYRNERSAPLQRLRPYWNVLCGGSRPDAMAGGIERVANDRGGR